MQTRAILEAAATVAREGVTVHPKIMIPLVGHVNELREVRRQLEAVAAEVTAELGGKVEYKFGTNDRTATSSAHCRADSGSC